MRVAPFCLVAIIAIGSATAAFAQPIGRVTGTVADESGGVLPGVTVNAASLDGRALATVVTDGAGAYSLDGLPALPIKLTFQLEGFSPATSDVTVAANGAVEVKQRLSLAARTEDVTVYGKAPAAKPAPVEAPPPPPRPVVIPVPEHAHESVCGPAKVSGPADNFGTIRARRYGAENGLYFSGDQLTVDRGVADGLEVGANFTARRLFKATANDSIPTAEHTAGVVQVVAAGDHDAVVVVVYACDEVMRGDTLAAFKPEPVVAPEPLGTPAFDDAARILFADQGQIVGGPRRLMVIDRGIENGLHPGQRLTLFRRAPSTGAPSIVGDAVVVAVRSSSSTIRVEHATDAVTFGDWAAPQRYPAALAAARRP